MVDITRWKDKNPLILVKPLRISTIKPCQQPDMLHQSGHIDLLEPICQFRL